MPLPDVSRLLTLPEGRWRALGEHLSAIGFIDAYLQVREIGGQIFEPMCLPLRRWHIRRMAGPVACALGLFLGGESVSEDAAREALGDLSIDELAAAGLLERLPEGRVRAALRCKVFEGLLFLTDDLAGGEDAVMAAGVLTLGLVHAALATGEPRSVRALPESALEVGCGAGVNALCLARRIARVVATDINPRAIVMARVNAALNGIENIELREGDLFAPVAGERFDLVICQPPFIPMPDEATRTAYMHGGRRGDELPLRVIAGVSGHLTSRGRGLVVAEWPEVDDEALERRIRAVVPDDANVLVLRAEGPDLDVFCAGDAAYAHPDFGPAYARDVVRLREHLAALGVGRIACALTVIESAARQPAWTAAFEVAHTDIAAAQLDAMAATAELLSRGQEALLGARLRLAEDAAFAIGKTSIRVIHGSSSARKEVALNAGAHRVGVLLDASPSVQAAARRFAKEGNYATTEALKRFLPAVEQLLRAGVVVVA